MKTRTSIITLAAIALTGAAALTGPAQAQVGVGAGVSGNATLGAPAQANAGVNAGANANAGVPNVTLPSDTVRQGAAGINSAQAEATRTTGDAAQDAQARAENEIARSGLPEASASGAAGVNAAGRNAQANAAVNAPGAANEAARAANAAANRGANIGTNAASGATSSATNLAGRTEEEVTQQLNREQAANTSTSANVSTR